MQKTITAVLAVLLLIGFASCDYGKKTKTGHIETYYQEGISEDQAKKVSSLIYNIDERAGNAKTEKSFQLCKKNDTVCFRMVVNKDKAMALGDLSFLIIANMVSDSVFNSAPVNVDLTNNKFESIKMISYKKLGGDSPEK